MKVLKPLKSGLVVYEDFSTALIKEPLKVYANFTRGTDFIDMTGGSIDMYVYPYHSLVFEIENSFVPLKDGDMGGVRIVRGTEKRELYEYYEELDSSGVIQYVKVVKNGDVYTGYGSNDAVSWNDKGYIVFPGAETIGVSVDSTVAYRLYSIKAYESEYVTIHSVLPGWRLEIYKNGILTVQENINDSFVKAKIPSYPFTGTFKLYDETDQLISDFILTDVWGGDEYTCAVDVDVLTWDEIPLSYEVEQHLGNLQNGKIENWYIARNYNDVEVTVTLRIADYSPFWDWVYLATDTSGVPGDYSREITVSIPALSDAKFWLKITRPDDPMVTDYDYHKTECKFFLEVV